MDLTHCKHNVPMDVECMACEGHEANNAGAGIPSSGYETKLERLVEDLQAQLGAREGEIARLVQLADGNRLRAEAAERQADEWRAAALSLARAVGSYAEAGRIG